MIPYPELITKPATFEDEKITAVSRVLDMLDYRLKRMGITLKGKEDNLTALRKQILLGAVSITNVWEMAAEWILHQVILGRFQPELVNSDKSLPLITPGSVLTHIEISGADFHRIGRCPLFLTYKDQRRIVYKPSSLQMDEALFNTTDSVAKALSTADAQIPTYNIHTLPDADGAGGFMEFLPTTRPKSLEDQLKVFRSIGANMALSYLFGLDDIHQENYILMGDRLQLLDMEVLSGKWAGGGAILPGWDALLRKVIPLLAFSYEGQFVLPEEKSIKNELIEGFFSVIRKAKTYRTKQADTSVSSMLPSMDKFREGHIRIVPIATHILYTTVRSKAIKAIDYQAWERSINDQFLAETSILARDVPGTVVQRGTYIRILKNEKTYEALRRGDIPLFTRSLSEAGVIFAEDRDWLPLPDEMEESTKARSMVGQTVSELVEQRWEEIKDQKNVQSVFDQFLDVTMRAVSRIVMRLRK